MNLFIKSFIIFFVLINQTVLAMQQIDFKHKLFDLYNSISSTVSPDEINNYSQNFLSLVPRLSWHFL